MTDLFISYKAEDRSRVLPLVAALEDQGISVWWDEHIGGGDDWRETILRHLETARCVIVVWSRRSVGPKGEFVRDEASRAKRQGTYLPVRIDKVDPPLGFGEMQVLDLAGWKGDTAHPRFQAVLAAVRARLGIEDSSPSGRPHRSRAISRRSAVAGGAIAAAAVAGGGAWLLIKPSGAKVQSIAVLPFANLSGEPNQAYFSDGIAEELRSALARIPGLKVVARTSSEAVRNADIETAASKLHVENVLTGSVRRSAQMIRVSAQLIDGGTGTERWSEVYDRPVGDALQIQTDIANMVAQAFSIHLGSAERRALKEGGTGNAEAQDLLLQAQAIVWRNDDAASFARALDLVDQALSLDPKYGDALTAKASIFAFLGGYLASSAADAQRKLELAETFARQAIRVAPRSAQAHGALANILWAELRLRPGLAEFGAMEKLPGASSNYFSGFDAYVLALVQCRRFGPASARADQLIAADPLNPNLYSTKAITLASVRRFAEAEQVIQQALALGPDLIWPKAFHAFYLMQMGRLSDARKEFTALGGAGPWVAWAAVAAERSGDRPEADRLIAVMHKSMGDGAHFQYAQVYAQQGRPDEAIAALEAAWDMRDSGLNFLQVDAMMDPLRKDPRFQAIVKRLDFPT